jgi:type VI secretion system protein ImpE
MSSAEESIREGNLPRALEDLQQRVRRNPGAAPERAFLFQLLALLGHWKRAADQLKVLGELDAGALITVQMYQPAIQCELIRAEVFAGRVTPLFLGEPSEWTASLLQSLKLLGGGHFEAAAKLRDSALQAAPASSGTLNGERFEWVADADTRIGPCLELIVNGKYYWAEMATVRSLRLEPPADLRDLLWSQGIITLKNGGEVPTLVPVRYPTEDTAVVTDAHRLARKTDWHELRPDTFVGVGQRMLATDSGEYPLLEIRELLLDSPGDPAGPA